MVEAPNSPSSTSGGITRVIAGSTTIDASVIATVAGIAANGVDGVYAVGGAASRALGVIRDAVDLPDRVRASPLRSTAAMFGWASPWLPNIRCRYDG